MVNYPDWVMKYKEKSTFINYSNGKCYLYAVHSERVPSTSKVKRVYDEYLGRITEKDGLILILPIDKVSGDVHVLEYGLCYNSYDLQRSILDSVKISMIELILSWSLPFFLKYSEDIFKLSYLSIRFPDVNFSKNPISKQLTAIERGIRMINDTLTEKFKSDKQDVMLYRQ